MIEEICDIHNRSISIEDLRENKDKSYKWMMDNTEKMLSDYGNILSYFIRNKEIDDIGILHEYLDWVYCEGRSNYRFRFMIVRVDEEEREDYVLVPFKVVTPRFGNIGNVKSYMYISNYPISYFKLKTQDKVIEVLKEYKCVREIMTSQDIKPDGEVGYMRCNYYNYKTQWDEMNRGKWKSKHGINILSKIISVDYNDCSDISIEEYDNLFKRWCDLRKEKLKEDSYGVYMTRELKIGCRDEKVNIISFRYRGELVGFTLGNIVGNKFYFCNECKSSVFDELVGNEKDIENIRKYLGGFMIYHLHRYAFDIKDVEVFSYYGVLDNNKDLKKFKEKYFKNVCYYDRHPIKEFTKKEEWEENI